MPPCNLVSCLQFWLGLPVKRRSAFSRSWLPRAQHPQHLQPTARFPGRLDPSAQIPLFLLDILREALLRGSPVFPSCCQASHRPRRGRLGCGRRGEPALPPQGCEESSGSRKGSHSLTWGVRSLVECRVLTKLQRGIRAPLSLPMDWEGGRQTAAQRSG